jgi:adenylylsulfate kinase
MFRETHSRSVLKALSWRIFASVITTALVYALTGQLALSAAVGSIEFVTKLVAYWIHERAWDHVSLGRVPVDVEPPRPAVLWFTGLSGAGKSTLSDWVTARLRARGIRVEQLDGDAIRNILPNTGFSKADRDAHVRRVGYLASKLEQNGVVVVASFVSPYRESREFARTLCRRFIEIHVSTPLDECERRDVKGLYGKARRGEIRNFTGIDDPYEPPVNPELTIDTSGLSIEEAGLLVLTALDEHVARSPVQRAAWEASASSTA